MTNRMDHCIVTHLHWSRSLSFSAPSLRVYVYPSSDFLPTITMDRCYGTTVGAPTSNVMEFPLWSREGAIGGAAFVFDISVVFALCLLDWHGLFALARDHREVTNGGPACWYASWQEAST